MNESNDHVKRACGKQSQHKTIISIDGVFTPHPKVIFQVSIFLDFEFRNPNVLGKRAGQATELIMANITYVNHVEISPGIKNLPGKYHNDKIHLVLCCFGRTILPTRRI